MDAVSAAVRRHIVISTRSVRRYAGSSRVALALVEGLSAAGYVVEVVADRLDIVAVRAAGGIPRYPLGGAGRQFLARKLLGREQLQLLRERAVRRSHADLVIGDGDLASQDVLLVHNLVAREMDLLGEASREAQRLAAAQARAVRSQALQLLVVNSSLVREECQRRFGLPPERFVVIRPGHNPRQFTGADRAQWHEKVRAELGVAPGEFLVAFVASGHFPLRGMDILVAALARLPPGCRAGLRLLAVGHSENTGLLRAELERHGLSCGLITQPRTDSVERYYHAADLLFHPALIETFGLVCLEAAACGCPVLTSRAVGASEVFTGTGSAVVVDEPSAAAFAPVLARLMADAQWRSAVAESQQAAARRHDWDSYAARFIDVLGEHGLL